MILIFSDRTDLSTRMVIAHLNYYDEAFEVFLEDDSIEMDYFIKDDRVDYSIYKNNRFLCQLDNIKSIWYRRTDIQVCRFGEGTFSQPGLEIYSAEHIKTRTEQIKCCFSQVKCLGKFGFGNYNKIKFLEICNSLKIAVPNTLITRSKSKLIEFWNNSNQQIITKSLAYPYEYRNYDEAGKIESYKLGYTISVDRQELDSLPDFFDLSLFQEKLDKLFEIRTIFIAGKTFSQAIFSQDREEASLDYRLGYDSGMRMTNYTLPSSITNQIEQLMAKLGLNFGSLDIVVTKDNRYVFLEVNPNGQYGSVSGLTNSNVDHEIVKFLMN